MKLNDIDFGNVLGASGVNGFFGEGYWFHTPWKLFELDFSDMTFVSKTATMYPRDGHMPLAPDYSPRDLFPDCVKGKPLQGLMLNSVGLSNPGILVLLNSHEWQSRTSPFWISLMTLADSPQGRLEELERCIVALHIAKPHFLAPFGLQINLSCPNTGHDPRELMSETINVLRMASRLGVPVMPKFSIASAPIEAVMELDRLSFCDAICVSNTIPFGWEGIDWEKTWGTTTSPLAHIGGGGLSGTVLRPLVCDWIKQLRTAGFSKPINGGGGIMCREDVQHYHDAGASSVFLGSVAALRPWRVKGIVRYANTLTWK